MNSIKNNTTLFGFDNFDKIQNSTVLIFGSEQDNLVNEISQKLMSNNVLSFHYGSHSNNHQAITMFINKPTEYINKYITKNLNNSKIIIVYTKDLSGAIFVDCGDEYYYNKNETKTFQVSNITNDGIVSTCNPNNLNNDDTIIFKNIIGTNLETLEKEWSIQTINNTSFKLINFDIKDFEFRNATINNINKNILINHKRFNDQDPIIQKYIDTNTDFMPIVSIISSICVFEVLKLLGNIYEPINQWFEFNQDKLDYDNESLRLQNWLVYGCGTIGCDLIKNLSSLGFENISIIDNSIVESVSDGSLYQELDIGRFKTDVLCDIKYVNNNSDLKSKDGIFCCVNNVDVKRDLVEQCVKHDLPLIDGTSRAFNGSVSCMIPFITNILDINYNETTYPLCVITSFPNEINHTIEWAVDNFDIFINAPSIINKWIDDENYLDSLEDIDKTKAMNYINFLTFKYPVQKTNIFACIFWAIEIFREKFYHNIIKLLETFPPDHKLDTNEYYWSGGKRCPKPIQIDIDNPLHIDFIESTMHLLAKMSGIDDSIATQNMIMIAQNIIDDEVAESNMEMIPQNESNDNEIKLGDRTEFKSIFVPQNLGKKAYWTNEWLYSASNIRANNYGIPNVDDFYVNQYLYNKNPTLNTTSSFVAGLMTIEMIKHFSKKENSNHNINFINYNINKSIPPKAEYKEIAGSQVNQWTKFNYTKNSSLAEFKKYFEDIFKISITMIVYGTTMIYADFLGDDNLDKQLSELMTNEDNVLNILCDDDSKELPSITVLI